MPSMDIVSKPDQHEVRNAVEQAQKELKTRFDFKGTDAALEEVEGGYKLTANTEEKVKALADVLEDKFIKRKLSIKFLERKDPVASGARFTMSVLLKKSLDTENAKKIVAVIKENKQLKVTASIQNDKKTGDSKVRVESKNIDDLQAVQGVLRGKELPVHLTFENYQR
ncbi:MAG: YajQ family cyclic di-GMP-binding protein [Deltaproteobacteria bacterium]|nr:YajQ family cyclic di-GMP-binding protein [Deltaproteobacteria bacterium]